MEKKLDENYLESAEAKAFLKQYYRSGYEALLLKNGTFSYRKVTGGPERRPPRWSATQVDDMIARLVAGEKKISIARSYGIKVTGTLDNWIRKRKEEPERWLHPAAIAKYGPPPEYKPPADGPLSL